jgi:hypothetical protein
MQASFRERYRREYLPNAGQKLGVLAIYITVLRGVLLPGSVTLRVFSTNKSNI